MEIITNQDLNVMDYPVGTKIKGNLSTIVLMYDLIKHQLQDKNISNTMRINLVCRGSSGAIISGLIASYLINDGYIPVISHIKKEGEHSHSDSIYIDKYDYVIIIDDLISTGHTMQCIWNIIAKYNIQPDLLIVSGEIAYYSNINFRPKTLICQFINKKDIDSIFIKQSTNEKQNNLISTELFGS